MRLQPHERGETPDRAWYGFTFGLAIVLVVWLLAGPEGSTVIYLTVVDLLGASLLLAATVSARVGHAFRTGTVILGGMAFLTSTLVSIVSQRYAELSSAVVLLLVAVYLPVIVVVGMYRRRQVDLQLVLGAVTVYMVTGIAASMAFAVSAQLQSTDLLMVRGVPDDGNFRDYVYVSFVTLSTVGYGDITPLSGSARAIALFTALFGQLYLVTAVASVISLLSSQHADRAGRA
jgi:voltage-gated potassium channel